MTHCNRNENYAWKRCLVVAEFEMKIKNVDKNMSYNENPIQVLPRQLQFANGRGDVYFPPRCSQDVDGTLHHLMESKYFLNI